MTLDVSAWGTALSLMLGLVDTTAPVAGENQNRVCEQQFIWYDLAHAQEWYRSSLLGKGVKNGHSLW